MIIPESVLATNMCGKGINSSWESYVKNGRIKQYGKKTETLQKTVFLCIMHHLKKTALPFTANIRILLLFSPDTACRGVTIIMSGPYNSVVRQDG